MCGIKKATPVDGDPKNYLGIEFEHRFRNNADLDHFQTQYKKNPLLAAAMEHHYEHVATFPGFPRMGWEASLLLDQDNYKTALRDMLALMQTSFAYVDESCGLHVHVDLRNRGGLPNALRGLRKAIINARADLLTYCAAHRKPGGVSQYDAESTPVGREGYQTIEIRCMEANFDFPRICRYIDRILEIVNPFIVKQSQPELVAAA